MDDFEEVEVVEASAPEEPPESPLLHGKILLWMILVPGLVILLVLSIGSEPSLRAVISSNFILLTTWLATLLMGLGIFILFAGYFQRLGKDVDQ